MASRIHQSSTCMVTPGGLRREVSSYIPNCSSSHARFKEATPMFRSCDLFSEGPWKRHPRTLGLDEHILSFWSEADFDCWFVFSFGNACPAAFLVLVGPLNGLFSITVGYYASIHVSGFYRDYKTCRWVSGSPNCSFVIIALKFYYAHALPC
jgi:hypothetical protein